METLHVDLGERSYPIYIGPQLLENSACLLPHLVANDVMIVTNETIAPLYLDRVCKMLGDCRVEAVVLPDGEQYKNLETLNLIFDKLLEKRFNRKATLVALGGGVVGDMTGFAAACYQRGVAFIQIPTTLLSQVDSSVGGKTGVNHALGKNMIGAFHQPRAVLADISVLNSLPDRELSAGLAEVIKYGLIADEAFLVWLEANMASLVGRDAAALTYAIRRSCEIKADVVARDEKEGGLRANLNLGHTFGHAIETARGYGDWLHGEAVAAGMVMAVDLSVRLGWLEAAQLQRTIDLIVAAGLPVAAPASMDVPTFLDLMAVDKKVLSGKIRLVLLKAMGQAVVTEDFSAESLEATISACIAAD